MNYVYLCLGIGIAIVIIGTFVIFKLESNQVSKPNITPQQNSTSLKENTGILSGIVSIKEDIVCKLDRCFGGDMSAGYEVDVYSSNGTTIVEKTFSDTQGHYSFQLPAGKYIIFNDCAENGQTTNRVKIVAGQTTILNISCHITK